jgi:hypothetical protein
VNIKISFLCDVTRCSLARSNSSVKVSTAVIKAHVRVHCPDSRGSKLLLNLGRYLQFTFQMNRGLTKNLVFQNCDFFVKVNNHCRQV